VRLRPSYRFVLGLALCVVLLPTLQPSATVRAQEEGVGLRPVVSRAVRFGVTTPVRDLPAPVLVKPEDQVGDALIKAVPNKIIRTEAAGVEGSADPVVQTEAPVEAIAPPSLSFEGLNNDDNAALIGGRVLPPDTVGDVGPQHYVQMVNSVWRAYHKDGTPAMPARSLASLFAALGPGNPCSSSNDGDPIVLYDELAGRWLLSEFCTVANPNNHQLIAISQTGDPTGAYFVYDFMMPNNKFNDYPKFGVWPDAYYMTDNQFNQAGTAFLGGGVFAFDRAKMLAGDPTASYIYFDLQPLDPNLGGMLPADLDGLVPPAPGTPGLFVYFIATEFGDASDGLRIFDFHADFASPASSTFSERAESPIAVAAFDPRSPTGRDDIEQPPPASNATAALDAISDRLLHRLAYRNFGSHESLVVNHTVNVGTGTTQALHQAGVRYYELRRAGGPGPFGVVEQATFAPDTHNRWMGSAAMDHQGDLAVGYSISSTTVFPGIRYAGRLASDPPNGLFQGETTLQAGSFVQTNSLSRWGDYSAMNVDPDGCTFWYTNEYYAADNPATTAEWQTRIGSFSFAGCVPFVAATIQGVVRNATTLAPIAGAVVQAGPYSRLTTADGSYSMAVATGTYDMTAAKPGYQSDSASGVVAVAGATTVRDFALAPMPILISAGSSNLAGESCSPATGGIDPGESVSVELAIANTGTADTANLTATLEPTGGVVNPGPPQSYGVVVAGGPAVSRAFTFTADNGLACGSTLTATLSLQDGASNLGTVSYTFTLGALGAPQPAVVHGTGDIAVPIPDVSSVDIPIVVPDVGAIGDVNVHLRLNHTFDGDLEIRLLAPDGTVVLLSDNRGGSGDNFGTGGNDCSGTSTVFDDSASAAISGGIAPFAGSFRPDQPLSGLNGKSTAGTWTLRITDTAALDVGSVGCVKLEMRVRPYLCCPFVGGEPAVTAAPPAVLVSESCSAPNGAPDPDETVSFQFPLQNVGTGTTVDLVATLLPGGGVNSPSPPQSYGVLSPVGSAVSRTFSFVPSGACGSDITATFALEDVGGAGLLPQATFTIRLGSTTPTTTSFSNGAAITIPGAPPATSGPAAPYPSTIAVSGLTGTVSRVVARLNGLTHTFPDDLDVLLVGPGGQKVLLMSDAGGSGDVSGVNLTFDDNAATAIPDSTTLTSGTFRPANYGTGDVLPAPAPAGPYPDPQQLSVFSGSNPNGTWSLFVTDDAGGDTGSFAGGWELQITTAVPVCCDQPCSLTCPADITQGTDAGVCSAVVSFDAPEVAGSCGIVSCVPPSGSVFPIGSSLDTCTAVRTQDGGSSNCNFDITVVDDEPPGIGNASASPNVLWPPNHRMVNVTVNYTSNDNCAGACSLSVTSDEPVNGTDDGDASPDWVVVDAHHVRLRSERSGIGDGRTYTVTITCFDAAGNTAQLPLTVVVPLNQD
jgi:subtilisin-like proprotein convertase family protein